MRILASRWSRAFPPSERELERAVYDNLTGIEAGAGELEEMRARLDRQAEAVAKLVEKLVERGQLTLDDALEISGGGYWVDFRPLPPTT